MARVRIDDRNLRRQLARIKKLGADTRPITRAVGETVVALIQKNFRAIKTPDGKPWKPLKVRRGGIPLRHTGQLRNSIGQKTNSKSVVVGSSVQYAKFHQFGTKSKRGKPHIPARRFIPVRRNLTPALPAAWRAAILATTEDAAKKILKTR